MAKSQFHKMSLKKLLPLAEEGVMGAQNALATAYYFGEKGAKCDPVKAAEWFDKAAAQGSAYAQDYLGYMYERGFGVGKDIDKATRYYALASQQGSYTGLEKLWRLLGKVVALPEIEQEPGIEQKRAFVRTLNLFPVSNGPDA